MREEGEKQGGRNIFSGDIVFEINLGKWIKKQTEKIESYPKEYQLQGKESALGRKSGRKKITDPC